MPKPNDHGAALQHILQRLQAKGLQDVFPILFEGEPSAGHFYRELAMVLGQEAGINVFYHDCRQTAGAVGTLLETLQGLGRIDVHYHPQSLVLSVALAAYLQEPMSASEHFPNQIIFLDEIDHLDRADLDDLVILLERREMPTLFSSGERIVAAQDGSLLNFDPRTCRLGYTVVPLVKLAASSWSAPGRLPSRLTRLFRSNAAASDIDWPSIKAASRPLEDKIRDRDRREKGTAGATVTARASTAPTTAAKPRSSIKPARTKNRLWETMAVWAVAIIVAAPIVAALILFSMGLGEEVLIAIFLLLIIASAVSSFLVGFLVLWAMWKGIFMILSYKGPKRGQ